MNEICVKALAHDPQKRYQRIEEFRDDICEYLDESGEGLRSYSMQIGTVLADSGRKDESISYLTKAISKDPTLIQHRLALARIHMKYKDSVRALAILDRDAVGPRDKPAIDVERSLIYEAEGQMPEAISAAESAFDAQPDRVWCAKHLARLRNMKDKKDAQNTV